MLSHVASSYAAVMAIVNVATEKAYEIVDLPAMKKYLMSVKHTQGEINSDNFFNHSKDDEMIAQDKNDPSLYVGTIPGSMAIHWNGEMDIRGVYCSLVCADILGLLKDNEEFTKDVGKFLISCQTYEGGFSCSPFGEAHGGYTFCALGSFLILAQNGDTSCKGINFDRLMQWLSNRQVDHLGGFNGRINKLIDSCYSFWVGACFELADLLSRSDMVGGDELVSKTGEYLFHQEAL